MIVKVQRRFPQRGSRIPADISPVVFGSGVRGGCRHRGLAV